MQSKPDRAAISVSWVAAVLGSGSAAVSAYWAVGGDGLLDTVGGTFERWGRDRSAGVVVALGAIAVLKLVVGASAVILSGAVDVPGWMTGRVPRVLGWIAATVLTLYGGVLTAAGLLIEAGAIEPSADADRHAIAWHAWLWDPWFLLWGVSFVLALWHSRRGAISQVANDPRHAQ